MPDTSSYHSYGHPTMHRRIASVRPLPTLPMPAVPRSTHTRRPTGPRVMPAIENQEPDGIEFLNSQKNASRSRRRHSQVHERAAG